MTAPEDVSHLVLAAGPNVRIRLRTRADGVDEFRWRSDPETSRFDGRAANHEPLDRFLDAFAQELAYPRNDREQFAIDTIDGRHIGTIMLYNFGHGRESAELGISIGEPGYRDRGLGREAIILLLRWAWENRPLRSVHLHALAWNERALACFRKAGFAPTVRVLRDGEELVRMEVRREWWLLWEMEGRFHLNATPGDPGAEQGADLAAAGPER